MRIDRVNADRYLAFLGFALCFLFLLAIVGSVLPRATNGGVG